MENNFIYNKTCNYVFFGSSMFSIITLERLKSYNFLPSLIVTFPDRKKGRGLKIQPNEVKVWALQNKIDTLETEVLNKQVIDNLKKQKPKFLLISAFGLIFPDKILNYFPNKIINIHPSLLPKYRGASPLQSLILNNDKKNAGVTLFLLDKKMDHGDIIAQTNYTGKWPLSTLILGEKLFNLGVDLLLKKINKFLNNELILIKQNDNLATYTKKISKNDGKIKLNDPDLKNYFKYLSFTPWPGIYYFSKYKGQLKRIIIKKAEFVNNKFVIKKILPEGGKEINYSPSV